MRKEKCEVRGERRGDKEDLYEVGKRTFRGDYDNLCIVFIEGDSMLEERVY